MRKAPPADWLALPAVKHTLDALSASELASLGATSRTMRHAAADFTRTAMVAQHGLIVSGGTLPDLRTLETMPARCSIDLRRRGGRRVVRGSPIRSTCVGGYDAILTQAQLPPAQGDAWEHGVPLRKGMYTMIISGWCNPSHGLLDLWLCGFRITPPDGLDWCGERTTKQKCRAPGIRIPWTGIHRLLARVDRSNADPLRDNGFWMCLRHISFRREGGHVGDSCSSDWMMQRSAM